jgi:predicted nucleic acid-binding protein
VKAFVLDNSIAMRWLLASNKPADQYYAEQVLKTLIEAQAHVPDLWHLESINVLLSAEKKGELNAADVERFVAQLESLPIVVDALTAHQAFSRTLALAKAYKLSSYDAAYLELAVRQSLPLATLDKELLRAAKKAGIEVYLK